MNILQTVKNTDFLILILLLAAYILIENVYISYIIIYVFLILNTIYNIYYMFKYEGESLSIKNGLLLLLIYPVSYFLIIDPNAFYYSATFIFPFQNFFRMIFLLVFISYLTSKILPKGFSQYHLISENAEINLDKPNTEISQNNNIENNNTENNNIENNSIENNNSNSNSDSDSDSNSSISSCSDSDSNSVVSTSSNSDSSSISNNNNDISIYIEIIDDKDDKDGDYPNSENNYFFHGIICYFRKNKIIFFLFLFSMTFINILLFFYRTKFWIYFNKKEKFLPVGTSKNTTYYLTASIVNIEKIADDYISEMKKLINYLGDENVMVSIVENGDSKDNTRDYLIQFQEYLNKKNIPNQFTLKHEIDDPRKTQENVYNGRAKYYTYLRNKVFDLLYETKNIDFDNTKIIYFNDIIFAYEDIVKLISTNNENYDSVCAMDYYFSFYDTWVSRDLLGNKFLDGFPYFINSEAQEQVLNNKPVRVFSCWDGVIVFTASPLKNKKLQFRIEDVTTQNESECTYFNLDLETLGYTLRFINPEVKVAYEYEYYYLNKYIFQWSVNIGYYFYSYFLKFTEKRNKYMSNMNDKDIELGYAENLVNWYNYHKLNSTIS